MDCYGKPVHLEEKNIIYLLPDEFCSFHRNIVTMHYAQILNITGKSFLFLLVTGKVRLWPGTSFVKGNSFFLSKHWYQDITYFFVHYIFVYQLLCPPKCMRIVTGGFSMRFPVTHLKIDGDIVPMSPAKVMTCNHEIWDFVYIHNKVYE